MLSRFNLKLRPNKAGNRFALWITLAICLMGQMATAQWPANGNFSEGNRHWLHIANNGAVANYRLNSVSGLPMDSVLEAEILQLGPNAWSAQTVNEVQWPSLSFRRYKISLWAKGAQNASGFRIVNQNNTYNGYDLTVDTTWREYQFYLTPQEDGLFFRIHYNRIGTFWLGNFSIVEDAGAPAPVFADSLKHYAQLRNLNYGAAVVPTLLLSETAYRNVFRQQHNAMVAENAMKMDALYPTEQGGFNFRQADSLVSFAIRNGQYLRGHALLWHQSTPNWITQKQWQADSLRLFLKNYIQTVVGRYRGQIKEWDVVNEVLNDPPTTGFRNYVFTRLLGNGIVDSCFHWARAADPDVLLFYNDYSIEFQGPKRDAMRQMVQQMQQRGVPINGVGFQCHFNHNQSAQFYQQVESNVQFLASLGLKVAFTEVDLAITLPLTASKYLQQARGYGQLIQIALRNRPTVQTFVTWGFTDKYSWIPNFWQSQGAPKDDALPFDRNYSPKAAYDTLLHYLKMAPQGLKNSANAVTEKVLIYPQPTTGDLYISGIFSGEDIEVYDLHGRLLATQIYSEGQPINLHSLPKGLYWLSIAGHKKKFLKN